MMRLWKRIMPEHATYFLCGECNATTRSRAADRGDDLDRGRLLRLAYSLAGEVWTQGDTAYWFREPLSTHKQPTAVPTFLPPVKLPKPSKESMAEVTSKPDA